MIVGIYFIYNLGQSTGIQDGGMLFIYISTIVLASILGILIYYANNKFTKNKLVSYIVTLCTLYLIQDFIAARAQLVTFILFVLTIIFIENFLKSNKKGYLIGIILISIAIANIHSAVWPFFFILFIPYIAEYVVALLMEKRFISRLVVNSGNKKLKKLEKELELENDAQKKEKLKLAISHQKEKVEKEQKQCNKIKDKIQKMFNEPFKIEIKKNNGVLWLILVMIICIFTGLITPIGNTPYTYLIKTMQGNTTASISEHLPITLFEDKEMMITLAVFFIILIFTKFKIKLKDLFMFAGLTFLLFMSRRQTSMFILICGFTFSQMLTYLVEKYDKEGCKKFIKFMASILGKIGKILFIVLLSFAIYKPKMDDDYINKKTYPIEASNWIKENLNLEQVKIFNEYNFGSYLLFKDIPVFIDSRADLYAPEFNGKINEEGNIESRNIFSDYINIASLSTYYENKFEDYEITHLIIGKKSKLNMLISRDDKYRELYSDDNFIIYERNA